MSADEVEVRLAAARAALQAGEFENARALAARAVAADPRRAAGHHLLGVASRALGRTADAERHYRDALAVDPDRFETLLNLGALLAQRQALDEARTLYERAAAARPDLPHAHYNLGRLGQDRGDAAQAAAHYRRALEADPRHAPSQLNLGDLAQQAGRLDEAAACYRSALALRPGYAAAHNNLGTALQHQGALDAAVEQYRAATALDAGYAEAHCNLGTALALLHDRAAAERSFERALELEPGNAKARFALAALRGDNPERAPPEHVRSLFDDYAPRFDTHLVRQLEYRAPELIAARIAAHVGARGVEVLDLGCGTGLLGAALAPHARAIDGVDLSGGMLDHARAKGCYRELHRSDITEHLARVAPDSYDAIAAADVFIYVGALEAVFAGAARVLRAGGCFAFSVESPPDGGDGFRLQPTGRYAHGVRYVADLLRTHGLATVLSEPITVRKQGGQAVPGMLWLAAKPG